MNYKRKKKSTTCIRCGWLLYLIHGLTSLRTWVHVIPLAITTKVERDGMLLDNEDAKS